MAMSQLSRGELEAMNYIAHEIEEVFSARGHTVTKALDGDPSYRRGNGARAQLIKALVEDGIQRGTSAVQMGWETGTGGCREIHSTSEAAYKLFRLRKAELDENDQLVLLGDESILAGLEPPSLAFAAQERWVFAYTVSGDAPGRYAVAPVLGVTAGSPGHLVLGPTTWLDSTAPMQDPGRFTPADEALEGFEDVEDDYLDGAR